MRACLPLKLCIPGEQESDLQLFPLHNAAMKGQEASSIIELSLVFAYWPILAIKRCRIAGMQHYKFLPHDTKIWKHPK